jgi:hypothetical protein
MMAKNGVPQDPEVVALIGPYEVLPEVDGADEVWLGAAGAIWAGARDEPVLWREVIAMRVDQVDMEDVVVAVSIDVDTGPTPLAPDARVGSTTLCIGRPVDAFFRRANQVSERLIHYYLEQGVDRADWPQVELEPRSAPDPSPARWQALADQSLSDYEAVCPHGTDPVLGGYVEVAPSHGRGWRWALLGWLVGGTLLSLLVAGYPIDPKSLGFYFAIVVFALAVGLFWTFRGLRVWLLRDRRIRVGTDGVQVLPTPDRSHGMLWTTSVSAAGNSAPV